jgi:hypothetical protein
MTSYSAPSYALKFGHGLCEGIGCGEGCFGEMKNKHVCRERGVSVT